MTKSILYSAILAILILFSCKEESPFLLAFDYEGVLRSTNPKTGILEARNQIPQDFPSHINYIKYGEMEDYPENYKSYKEVFEDSTIFIFDIPNSGCMRFEGFTKLVNDTLFLDYKYGDIACTEEEIYRLKYVIENSEQFSFIDY